MSVGRSAGGCYFFHPLFSFCNNLLRVWDRRRLSQECSAGTQLQLTLKTTSRKFYKIISLLLSHSRIQKFKLHVFLEDREEVERGGGSDVKYCTEHTGYKVWIGSVVWFGGGRT